MSKTFINLVLQESGDLIGTIMVSSDGGHSVRLMMCDSSVDAYVAKQPIELDPIEDQDYPDQDPQRN